MGVSLILIALWKGKGRYGATNKKLLAFILECDGDPEVLGGKVKGMAEWIPRVGASLAGLDHRLLLVVPGAPKLLFF